MAQGWCPACIPIAELSAPSPASPGAPVLQGAVLLTAGKAEGHLLQNRCMTPLRAKQAAPARRAHFQLSLLHGAVCSGKRVSGVSQDSQVLAQRVAGRLRRRTNKHASVLRSRQAAVVE